MNNNVVVNLPHSRTLYRQYEEFNVLKNTPKAYQFDTSKTIKENLNSLALFALQGSTTLPIFYSFKDIFLDLISRWVSHPEEFETEYRAEYSNRNNEPAGVIRGSTILRALSRLVNISNESLNLIEFFINKIDFFTSIDSHLSTITAAELEHILLSFYRLITYDNHRFKNFILPHVLYTIIRQDNPEYDVAKYLAIRILSQFLSASEQAQSKMIDTHIGRADNLRSRYETDPDLDYAFLSLLEAKRLSNFNSLPSASDTVVAKTENIVIAPGDLSELVISICGVLVPNIVSEKEPKSVADPTFVATENSVNVLRQLAHNIQNNKPVMLYGKAGSGKSFLINQLANYMSYDNSIVKIHLGEQTDAKLLLGTYSSGEKPGTFEWRSGVLTSAVREGKWVLIEDIDKAPTEVLSILLTLLEKRELTIPSRGEVIRAKNGFQLISTIRISDDSKFTVPDLIGLRLWELIKVEVPNEVDLKNILITRFPLLQNLIIPFIKCYKEITRIYSLTSFISLNKGSHPRVISFRDLMKFCSRCNSMLINYGVSTPNQLLESTIYDNIFAEAVDCFGSAITEQTALTPLVNAIGEILEVPESRINLFLTKHIPNFINDDEKFQIGRATLRKSATDKALYTSKQTGNNTSFARTNHSLRLMEQIGVSIQMAEPVLLVGETGTGKTTVVQQIAKQMNKKLTVINVSQQTEAGDLLGGYKPVNTKTVAVPIQEVFENLFIATFSGKKNEKFSRVLSKCFNKNQWKNVIRLWREAIKMSKDILAQTTESDEDGAPKKKRKLGSLEKSILLEKWVEFEIKVKDFEIQTASLENSFVFNFLEGSLVKAVREGEWLLLDEINLASADTLESIADLLSESLNQRSVLLTEKGDVESIKAHPEFRIFGCMNPSTDVGKRDLPLSIRSRFSEIYVHSPDRDINDLLSIIDKYVGRYAIGDEWVGNDIAELYLSAKDLSESNKIVDGANQRPHFSIRTLTRTLIYVCDIVSIYGLRRSLYEGFCMAFLTLLDVKSEEILRPVIEKHTIGRLKNAKSVMSQIPPAPSSKAEEFVQFRHYWMKHGPEEVIPQPHYIITPFVEKNMLNLVRATAGRRFPVLVQGPTSAGKTSMIHYLANITGHKFVRINNHEHTDLQEYLGTYVSDSTGKLSFREGILVEALRKGHWIVLDELNLAPTDVLEALNRLLDDNRELFIPETQEVVHPHPDFMLFATQNPPGIYGGRKVLSRAFRNRFLELHFDDIPQDELETILKERCQIAPTYCKKIVEVYKNLSIQRQSTRLFEQKNSFATLRDLFRWALRDAVGYEELAANGYMLLAERVRKEDEKRVVKEVIEKVMRVKLDMNAYYKSLEVEALMKVGTSVVWTKAMRRLAVLVFTSMKYKEPLLLVGETGCGKTTVCQIIAQYLRKELITVNAHQNTETGDILGAQRPVRNRYENQRMLFTDLVALFGILNIDISMEDSTLEHLLAKFDSLQDYGEADPELISKIKEGRRNSAVLFEWNDGPLVRAMKNGSFFLLDEISLADDSVLERLNSVLEPERSLLLAEKGTDDVFVTGAEGFEFLATMNPGGDYGKKELSPALRNRFTEIWVPSMEDFNDVREIVADRLVDKVHVEAIVQFSEWYGKKFGGGHADSGVISLRDILAWVQFINSCGNRATSEEALLHGASMVFIDALGTNNTAFLAENEVKLREQKVECVSALSEFSGKDLLSIYSNSFEVSLTDSNVSAGPFSIARVEGSVSSDSFNLHAPTTSANTMRVIRAMQVHKPILLEGSPGVGKTSLVSAIAKATGNYLVRINLSEQTDLIDLFGSDAPAEGGKTGEFVWRDAPFLRAMQRGEWVLLDEMNLASQSVLEGLNACLDHRGEAYIPELDKSFSCHPDFKVFAAQNPQYQGGGRKGLPKSFVNRFSVVYVDTLKSEDLNLISQHLYPEIPSDVCSKIIDFMSKLEEQVVIKKNWGSSGGPWEFNLRDTLRWLELLNAKSICEDISPADFLNMIVIQRFRTEEDRAKAVSLFKSIFGEPLHRDNFYFATESYLQSGEALIKKTSSVSSSSGSKAIPLQCNFSLIETCLRCVNRNIPLILTGPSNSGKTELVRLVANAVGAKVDEFAMNSDVDSMDILGGYEQVDLTRAIVDVVAKVYDTLIDLVLSNLYVNDSESSTLSQSLQLISYISNKEISVSNYSQFHSFLKSFLSFFSNEALILLLEASEKLEKRIQEDRSVKFEWFDGLLVKAVEKGNWLVLDNANLCSPSVLDRLNSLLETNGSLIINECSNADGQPRTLKPHPNFRLFLTVNPKYGELSRAMRNRGIEIYLESLSERITSFDGSILGLTKTKHDKDITERLNELKVVESFIPTVGFVPANDTPTRTFALIDDVMNLNSKITSESINASLTLLPFVLTNKVESWASLVEVSSEFNSKTKEIAQVMLRRWKFLLEEGIVSKLASLFSKSAVAANQIVGININFSESQYLHPQLNNYLTALVKNIAPEFDSSEPTMFFEVVSNIIESIERRKTIEERANNARINTLSYVEKSAAFELGREIKSPPNLRIFKFIVEVEEFVRNVFTSSIESRLFSSDSTYKSLYDLQILVNGIARSSEEKSESKIRIYQELINKWIDNYSEAEFIAPFISDLSSSLTAFGDKLVLTSGFSMDALWEQFRRTYPRDENSWNNAQNLLRLANEFDLIAREQFVDVTEYIVQLRLLFIQLYSYLLSDSFNAEEYAHILSTLELGISKLSDASSSFLYKRQNTLELEFAYLHNFVNSPSASSNWNLNDSIYLASLANRSTAALLQNPDCKEFYPYPAVLDSLWHEVEGSSVSLSEGLFSNDFASNLLKKSGTFGSVAGKYLQQDLEDFKLMGRAIVKHSAEILIDQRQSFRTMLQSWFFRILESHSETFDECTYTEIVAKLNLGDMNAFDFEAACNLIQRSTDEYFVTVVNDFFIPSMIVSRDSSNLGSLGKAWVLFSCGCIQLFVPSSPYDPAIREYIIYDRFEEQKQASERLISSWRTIRAAVSGDEKIHIEDCLLPISDDAAPQKPMVYRPTESFDGLFEEWNSFMDSTISIAPVQALLKSAENLSASSEKMLDIFQKNSSKFLFRLRSNYLVYSDLNDILKGYIYGLKLGFELLSIEGKRSTAGFKYVDLWSVDASELAIESSVISMFEKAKNFNKKISVDSQASEQLMLFFIKLCYSHKAANTNSVLSDVHIQSFQSLYYRWTLRRMKEEEENLQKGNLYKYSDPDSDIEGDFRKLFPDYEEVFDSDVTTSKNNNSFDTLYYDITQAYIDYYTHNKTNDLSSLVNEGNELNKTLSQYRSEIMKDKINSSVLSSLITSMASIYKKYNSNDGPFDFYHDSSPSEAKKSIVIISRVHASVSKFLEQWPEHATLQNITKASDEFLMHPLDSPVAKLLQKVEQIYTLMAEWQKYASSQVSLKENFDELTTLIVNWRRLELSTWNTIFLSEEKALEKGIGKWWFHLFESIIVPILADNEQAEFSPTKLLSALNVFMSKTTYGEFVPRLNLLKAFKNHVSQLLGESNVYHALSNFILFYEQFVPLVADAIAATRKTLEKNISEVILLASWKDVNIDALKQSARKSHNSLYKVVRKYRAILATEVSPLIEAGIAVETKSEVNMKSLSRIGGIVVDNDLEICSAVSSWKERPARLQNLDLVNRNMGVYINRITDESLPNLMDYAKELFEEMERLRKETPKELKEANKKLITALKTQKKKLLSDTLKELRRIGLKTALRADIVKGQGGVNVIVGNSSSFEGTELESSDVYFYRILDILPKLRASISNVAEDVPQVDADKGLAAAENLVNTIVATRDPLRVFSEYIPKLAKVYKSLEIISQSRSENIDLARASEYSSIEMNLHGIKYVLHWLPKLIDFALLTAQAVDTFEPGTQSKLFYDIKLELSSLKNEFDSIDPYVRTSATSMFIRKFAEEYIGFSKRLNSWKLQYKNAGFIAEVVLSWMNSVNFSGLVQSSTSLNSLGSLENVEISLRKLSNSIIVAVQRVTECQEGEITEENDNWLVLTQTRIMKYIKSLHSKRIHDELAVCLDTISSVEQNTETSKVTSALVSFTLPLINHYFRLSSNVFETARDNYYNTSRATFMMTVALYNLATKGFCSPEPPTEQKEDNNLHDGTGLGDGEGATNNSNDVEDDEDLSEQAQQPNEENNDDDNEEENDDAVDIEGDMAGNLENASDQEDDENDGDEDDQEDLDEEIDDLDDLDPNAIDEKMWDEEVKEDKNEKESDEVPENANKDDDNMEANEDEDSEQSKDKEKKQSEQGEEDKESEEKEKEEENGTDEEGEENDVGEQEDEVNHQDNEQVEDHVPQTEALDLPDDINLDDDEEADGDDKEEEFDDKMDVDDEEEEEAQGKEEENQSDAKEDGETEEGVDEEGEEDEEGEDHDQENGQENDNNEIGEEPQEENENDGEQSDEETLGNTDEKEEENEHGNDAMDQDAEGVDGANQDIPNEDIDAESAVKQEAGDKGEGADNQVSEENDNIGSTGNASSDPNQQDKEEDNSVKDDARDMAKESLKQLGDTLKEFHRRRQEIKEAAKEEKEKVEEKANERPDEFQHVQGENTDFDTQALGAADKDQVQSLDEDMAIDDDIEEDREEKPEIKQEAEEEVGEEDMMDVDEDLDEVKNNAEDDNEGKTKGAFIGERDHKNDRDGEISINNEINIDDDQESEDEENNLVPDAIDGEEIPTIEIDEARQLWKHSDLATQELASGLCEQLRLILEPTLATKLRGDFKTGKRLNMKRIIPYIASEFRKDKIWLRRTKPSKRQYQIMIAVDDSKSMSESKSTQLAFHSIALVAKALTQLESGGLSIVRFGEDVKVVHPFDKPFNGQESGARIFQWFDFQQTKTDIKQLCNKSLKIFEDARSSSNSDLWQLQIIISDGVCEDHDTIERLVRRAREEKIMLVFVVIDGINSNESILDMSQVQYEADPKTGAMNLKVVKYLDSFPFEFFVVVRNINELPEMLALILRQYFTEVASI
ncbi:large protein with a conserved N-terminal domain, a central AAA ATPase domain composed of 6 tandem AAA protomers, and a C-terminal M-domain midas sequence motif-containing protein [Scheffersomyces stipitis CBS 6054]|uniref:Midasin n=1 Tax=Scheffersomyces stipitis (strain ATCC 58785 / CBS 6054 / NBRC 10063 / NRRL Y-11545) TaxID=322104 RepID=A3LSZ4_PICST|nr:large protein with a conserved N-terminal domain, a central AAA ATPase domain composed of 6 tandem AAA protomers, and a C-terminal M-domain midas sequence motif-containing protein [Scheffersomyces stipitis CBS 6054]ABN66318.2 large protein with a conserved N-terminal domain, a central AAA ATPase domain composed of 6 tandem AAA protomers, and a C-terminal M-domain midas sequence motif-containing protein [Scheffersomyces stipitis CBS 6054]